MTRAEREYWQACIDARNGLPVSVGLALRAMLREKQAEMLQKYDAYVRRLAK